MIRTLEATICGALFLVGQVTTNEVLGPASNLSAVGILGWISYQMLQELKQHRQERETTIKAVFDRQHDDSEKLNETLRTMTAQCATTQAELRKSNGKNA